jgi:glycosyltransferase involved in cell wall biosynthesis
MEKVPLGAARNLAIAECRGEFLSFLDCDDLWLPHKTITQLPYFQDEEVGLVYSDALFFNEKGYERRLFAKMRPYRGRCFPELLNRYVVSLETVMIRRSVLDGLEHWFTDGFDFIEEYDLFVRIGLVWKVDYVPAVLAKWRVHRESLSWQFPHQFSRERRIMLKKLQLSTTVVQLHFRALREGWIAQTLMEARTYWDRGERAAARSILRDAPRWRWKHWALFVATFLPRELIQRVYNRMMGRVTPADEISK